MASECGGTKATAEALSTPRYRPISLRCVIPWGRGRNVAFSREEERGSPRIWSMTQDTIRARVIGELGPLRRYALALTRDPVQADDLVQEALLRAFERRASFRPDGPLRSWLLSILHNCFIDGRRRDDARGRRDAAFMADEHSAPAQEHVVRLGQVAAAFLALPAEQRAALHLVAVEGLSYAEAAAVLDIPAGTLMSRISRARAALRAMEDGQARPRGLRLVGGVDDPAD